MRCVAALNEKFCSLPLGDVKPFTGVNSHNRALVSPVLRARARAHTHTHTHSGQECVVVTVELWSCSVFSTSTPIRLQLSDREECRQTDRQKGQCLSV